MTLNIEDSFAKLKFEWDQKSADLAALETQRRASGQRLDDALKREAEAQAALKKVTAELEAARKTLGETGRVAKQLVSDAQARAAQIIADAHDEAAEFLKNVRTAVAAAASLIPKRQQENENA
jgi:F0F1-type ATP synthase membrane subunit b/b'